MSGNKLTASRRRFVVGLSIIAAAALGLPHGASAQDFPFKNGEIIRLIVPYGPGGGFDRVLRLIQPYFESALNGLAEDGSKVTVLVENMPGAGGRVSYEYVYNSPPDGTNLVLIGDQGAGLQQVALGASFDLDKFSYIAGVNNSDWGILVRKDTGITSLRSFIDRAQKTPILFGTSGAGSGDHIASILLQAFLKEQGIDMPIEHAHFKSSATVFASMQRGEAEAYIGSVESTKPATDEGYADIVSVFAKDRSEYFPDAQTTVEEDIPGAEHINSAIGISRALVGPPGLPENVSSALRKAAEIALTDAELIEAANTAQLPIQYTDAGKAKQVVDDHSEGIVEYQDLIKSVVN